MTENLWGGGGGWDMREVEPTSQLRLKFKAVHLQLRDNVRDSLYNISHLTFLFKEKIHPFPSK